MHLQAEAQLKPLLYGGAKTMTGRIEGVPQGMRGQASQSIEDVTPQEAKETTNAGAAEQAVLEVAKQHALKSFDSSLYEKGDATKQSSWADFSSPASQELQALTKPEPTLSEPKISASSASKPTEEVDYQSKIADFLQSSAREMEQLGKSFLTSENIAEKIVGDSDDPISKLSRAALEKTLNLNPAMAAIDTTANIEKMLAFVDLVKTGAKYDIKGQSEWQHPNPGPGENKVMTPFMDYNGQKFSAEELGNFAFGYYGAAYGFSEEFLCLGAGLYQIASDVGSKGVSQTASTLGERIASGHLRSYGDDPRDTQQIRAGYQQYVADKAAGKI